MWPVSGCTARQLYWAPVVDVDFVNSAFLAYIVFSDPLYGTDTCDVAADLPTVANVIEREFDFSANTRPSRGICARARSWLSSTAWRIACYRAIRAGVIAMLR